MDSQNDEPGKGVTRRRLLQSGLGAAGAALPLAVWLRTRGVGAQTEAKFPIEPKPVPPSSDLPPATARATGAKIGVLPTRLLGQTGVKIPIFGLGGASSKTPLSRGPRGRAVAIIERALDLGVTYFDTAVSYGNGRSESALGEVAKTRRGAMFLASKTGARTYDGAMRDLETSLTRLQTDHLDLWQMHHVSLADRDTAPAFASNGALKALERAKDQKIVRFGGVSGHHRSDVLVDWLQRFEFDTLLLALNAADVHHTDSLIQNVIPIATKQKIGVVAMKIPAYGALLNPAAGVSIRDALGYSMSLPGVACGIIACDSIEMLEENVAAAAEIKSVLAPPQMRELEAKTASYASNAWFYRSWT